MFTSTYGDPEYAGILDKSNDVCVCVCVGVGVSVGVSVTLLSVDAICVGAGAMVFSLSVKALAALSFSTELVETEIGTGVLLALLQLPIANTRRQIKTNGIKTAEQHPLFFLLFSISSPREHIFAK